jgi:hypothetical protein
MTLPAALTAVVAAKRSKATTRMRFPAIDHRRIQR